MMPRPAHPTSPVTPQDGPRDRPCDLCSDLEVVRYSRHDAHHPAPFCGTCGRQLDLVMVDVLPWAHRYRDFRRTSPQTEGAAP